MTLQPQRHHADDIHDRVATLDDVDRCSRLFLGRAMDSPEAGSRLLADAPDLWTLIGRFAAASDASLQPETIVRILYRALLAREADAGGLSHYAGLLRNGSADEPALAKAFIDSPECRRNMAGEEGDAGFLVARAGGCELIIPDSPILLRELEDPAGYEPWVLPYFLEVCTAGTVILDVGASIGAFALPAARKIGPAGCVYAVEASPANNQLLAQSIARNRLGNVALLPLAVSDALGSARLHRQHRHNNTSVDPDPATRDSDLRTHDVVATVPLDLLAAKLRKIDLLKLDVEGMEYRVVRGARALLARDRPIVFLEYSSHFQEMISGVAGAALLTLFLDMGYRIEILHRSRPRETVPDGETIARVDSAWRAHRADGGTHLDLCLHPHR